MPSLGMIGALGGLGKGMADVALEGLEEAKLTRLEELRTRNNRETNKLDSDQRHGYAVEEANIQHGYRTKEQEMGNKQDLDKLGIAHDYSLSQQAQSDADALARLDQAHGLKESEKTTAQKEAEYWESQGIDPKQQYQDSQSGSNVRQPDRMVIGNELLRNGVSQEAVNDYMLGKKSAEDIQREYIKAAMSSGTPMDQAKSEVDAVFGAKPSPQEGDVIQKILAANPGKDEAWAQRYVEHLKAQGKL